jgi:hypothetical protein
LSLHKKIYYSKAKKKQPKLEKDNGKLFITANIFFLSTQPTTKIRKRKQISEEASYKISSISYNQKTACAYTVYIRLHNSKGNKRKKSSKNYYY